MINEFGGDFIQWLRGFYYVAKTGSVSLAAFEMGRNQPAISHQVKCLEEEFGAKLFDRSSGKMMLTVEGEKIFNRTLTLFEVVKQMEADINEDKFSISGNISIASTHAVILYYLSNYVAMFRDTHHNVDFDLVGGGVNFIFDQVESSGVDFGVACSYGVPEDLRFYELFNTSPMLITPQEGPLSFKKKPRLKKISELPFIMFPSDSTLAIHIIERFNQDGLKPNVVIVLNNFDNIKKYVELGQGVSIIEGFTITKNDYNRLNIFPLEEYFEPRIFGIVMRKKRYYTPVARAFLRQLKPDISFN
jgi:DNA-binding transcriptional LysR family regulator